MSHELRSLLPTPDNLAVLDLWQIFIQKTPEALRKLLF